MKKCPVCQLVLKDDDRVLENKGNLYHRECLELVPTAYDVFTVNGELLESGTDPDFEFVHDHK
ncbi:hypothetical protein [Enterococcus hulanensis]|uniref:hypothetical protein n=1 Tax=Enterococcus hulanensis TaxID=2559929 RepID=UPI0010F871E0|nr:hypothetical protein [Enterococcus hulanensis]